MMVQARGYMDVPSEPLGDFYWSMRPVSNACNFVGAARVIQEGVAVDPFLAECEQEARDLYQTKFDLFGCGMESHDFGQTQSDALKLWAKRHYSSCYFKLKRSLISLTL
jgi:hypothetical protein